MSGWIWRSLFVAALLAGIALGGAAVRAQAFPGPGEGVYTWERVGDVPVDADALDWTPDGRLTGVGSPRRFFVHSGDGPSGTWEVRQNLRTAFALITLSDGTILTSNGTIDRSTDGGLTWARVCDPTKTDCVGPRNANGFEQLPPGHAHAGRVVAGARLYSDDSGATWSIGAYDGPQADQPLFSDIAVLPSGRLLAAADGWGMLASDDGGASWTAHPTLYVPYRYAMYGVSAFATSGSVQSGAPSCGLADVALCEGAIAIGTDAQDAFNRTWRTNDGGRTWVQGAPLQQVYDGVAWAYVAGLFDVGLDAATGLGRAVAVLGRGFVFATRDGGQTWDTVARVPVVEPDVVGKSVRSAVVGPDGRLYAAVLYNGTGREWVYRTVEPVTAAFAVADEAGPAEVSGLGVTLRPNPAGGRVEVVLRAAEAGNARVVVVDALGREVAAVLDGTVAAGERVVALDTGGWPAGVYVVRAAVGGQTAAARLVVAR